MKSDIYNANVLKDPLSSFLLASGRTIHDPFYIIFNTGTIEFSLWNCVRNWY